MRFHFVTINCEALNDTGELTWIFSSGCFTESQLQETERSNRISEEHVLNFNDPGKGRLQLFLRHLHHLPPLHQTQNLHFHMSLPMCALQPETKSQPLHHAANHKLLFIWTCSLNSTGKKRLNSVGRGIKGSCHFEYVPWLVNGL